MRVNQLKNHFLVAMPTLSSDAFSQSVIYIYQHNEKYSQGIMINKTLSLSLNALLSKIRMEKPLPHLRHVSLYYGGPVNHNKTYIISQPPDSEFPHIHTLSLAACRQQLGPLTQENRDKKAIVALGCSQWDAGQLEYEIKNNFWLVVPYNAHTLFETTNALKWNMAAQSLGVDMCQVSGVCGSA
ncbi:MAG: YqgE/AlgH family protein [Coxiellaceae bacterium]|nr:YqgE/AlgH family protein [Coxiellaceae bacterium]